VSGIGSQRGEVIDREILPVSRAGIASQPIPGVPTDRDCTNSAQIADTDLGTVSPPVTLIGTGHVGTEGGTVLMVGTV
jgi:hypothetical protein